MLDSPLRQIIYYARTIISSLILQNLKYCYLVTKLNWMISQCSKSSSLCEQLMISSISFSDTFTNISMLFVFTLQFDCWLIYSKTSSSAIFVTKQSIHPFYESCQRQQNKSNSASRLSRPLMSFIFSFAYNNISETVLRLVRLKLIINDYNVFFLN